MIAPVYCAATARAFRRAVLPDLPDLLAIEAACFPTDQMTARQFRHAITKAKGVCLVALRDAVVVGYGQVATHARTPIGRLTSLAVHPDHRRFGVARALLTALEEAAQALGCDRVRLEVRRDNTAALALYLRSGYTPFGLYEDYYEDGMAALRLERRFPLRDTVPAIVPTCV
ncbi:GNAT family N-acetyltransferase [Azospirillum griseum]|uniref:GNAT family N-acetyltransferase n=1 Tax=Azospirillum griseum TaxID=2496639 RepID=UPI0013158448|nr:N-acetyltransferase [Azospirillum griseum]